MPIEYKYISESDNVYINNRGQVDIGMQNAVVRRELGIIMPECCASCPKVKSGTPWQCKHPKILKFFGSKIVYTSPDLLCKYYAG